MNTAHHAAAAATTALCCATQGEGPANLDELVAALERKLAMGDDSSTDVSGHAQPGLTTAQHSGQHQQTAALPS